MSEKEYAKKRVKLIVTIVLSCVNMISMILVAASYVTDIPVRAAFIGLAIISCAFVVNECVDFFKLLK